MKKINVVLLACVLVNLFATTANAAYVEFVPNKNKIVNTDKVKNQKVAGVKTMGASVQNTNKTISEDYIKNLISATINKLIESGALKGEKGDKGDSGINNSFDPDATGFQQIYIPGAVIAPDTGTYFAATNLSSDVLNSSSASIGTINSSGELNVEGSATFTGEVEVTQANISSLNVEVLTSTSGAYLSEGGDWVNASSRELKENFASVTPSSILQQINSLPIYTWNYKNQTATTTHIGPTAEDFKEIFQIGDGKSISTIDPAGIALAGIQALDEKIKSLLSIDWVLEGFNKLKIEITEGLLKVQSLIAEKIQVGELVVGSTAQPTGITIYDRITKEPNCLFVENGNIRTEPGECSVAIIPAQEQTVISENIIEKKEVTENLISTVEVEEPKVVASENLESQIQNEAVVTENQILENKEVINEVE